MVKNLLISAVAAVLLVLVACEEYDADVAYLESKGIINIAIIKDWPGQDCGNKRFWSGYDSINKQLVSGCI